MERKVSIDRDFIEEKMKEILEKGLGLSQDDPTFNKTPKRVAKFLSDYFSRLDPKSSELKSLMERHFPINYDGMIIKRKIKVYSLCPHHLIPSVYDISIGFIPNERSTGFSNLSKMMEILGKKPVLQEELTQEIVECLDKWLEPKGSICIIHGTHLCIPICGSKDEKPTTTKLSSGVFLHEPDMETKFTNMISDESE